ncbi:MAG: transposase [Bacteroides sp.]|nr:transposase [Bacteroides sp.]
MNTITQQYVMAVFAVKYRLGLINPLWAPELYAMMGKILNDIDGVRPLKINGYKDHVHVLYSTRGMTPDAEIVRRLKTKSSRWLNEKRLTLGRFGWQRGGARISCSPSGLPRLKEYIDNQWQHHRVKTFREEYEGWLRSLGIAISEYDLPEEPQ